MVMNQQRYGQADMMSGGNWSDNMQQLAQDQGGNMIQKDKLK